MFDLSGKVALVTGAGQNIGAGIAKMLAAQGASVAVNDLRAERAEATVAALASAGGKAVAVPFDVADREAVLAGVRDIEKSLGGVDILVNNAGVPAGMGLVRFRETDPEDWRAYVDVNLYGVVNCTKAVIDSMCDRGFGRVITISSGAGVQGVGIGVALYSAGKGGGLAFMRSLAIEVARTGVTANSIALGLMGNAGDASGVEQLARAIPVGRVGTPEDAGSAVIFLASDEASWLTGQTIGVNGGSGTS